MSYTLSCRFNFQLTKNLDTDMMTLHTDTFSLVNPATAMTSTFLCFFFQLGNINYVQHELNKLAPDEHFGLDE